MRTPAGFSVSLSSSPSRIMWQVRLGVILVLCGCRRPGTDRVPCRATRAVRAGGTAAGMARVVSSGAVDVGIAVEDVAGVVGGLDLGEPLIFGRTVAGSDPVGFVLGHQVHVAAQPGRVWQQAGSPLCCSKPPGARSRSRRHGRPPPGGPDWWLSQPWFEALAPGAAPLVRGLRSEGSRAGGTQSRWWRPCRRT
jgi:hypothetical protein